MSLVSPAEPAAAPSKQTISRGVAWRSVLLGTLTVIAIAVLTPINDFIFSNTSVTTGFLPLAAVLTLFIFVVVINAPLHRWFPKFALSSGELAVIVLMSLIVCGMTNWGLMRFFIPTPVASFHVGAADEVYWTAFSKMKLPSWLFPVSDVENGRSDPVVRWFYTRVPGDEQIPWRAWVRPVLAWGVFLFAMLATVCALARLTFEQWVANERLPYPIVQVQSALLEAPEKGKALNLIFRSPIFWIGLCAVFAVHSLTTLNMYFPRNFPKFPLGYDLSGLFSEPPLYFLNPKVKKAALSFTVVGVTYFIRSRVAFSLWASYFICNLVEMQYGMRQGEFPTAAWQDQHLGACMAFAAGILWIGRHHWTKVFRAAIGLHRDRAHASALWIALIGMIVMTGWLRFVGVKLWVAMLIVGFIVTAHFVVMRVVAETGLPFFRSSLSIMQINSLFPTRFFSLRDVWFSQIFTVLGPTTTRDSVAAFTQQGLGVCRENEVRGKLGRVIALALIVGFFVAAGSTLYCSYSYPTPQQQGEVPERNYFGAEYIPKRDVANPFDDFASGKFTQKQHDPLKHMGIGFALCCFLEFASLRWAGWPLLPVGYVTSYGAFIGNAWFSIFVGWLAQLLVVRLGGAGLFQRARPLFIGIIFGEGLAAGFWLIVNVIVVMNGGESQSVKFLL